MFVFVIMLVLIVIYVSVNFICVICEMLILDQYHWSEKISQEAREEVARRFLGPKSVAVWGNPSTQKHLSQTDCSQRGNPSHTEKFPLADKNLSPNDLLDQKEKERPSKRLVGQKCKGRRAWLPTEIPGKLSPT